MLTPQMLQGVANITFIELSALNGSMTPPPRSWPALRPPRLFSANGGLSQPGLSEAKPGDGVATWLGDLGFRCAQSGLPGCRATTVSPRRSPGRGLGLRGAAFGGRTL